MNPVLQTVITILVSSVISPLIVFLVMRWVDKKKNSSEARLNDLDAVERYQKITNEAIADMVQEKNKRSELEQRVADLEAATVGPFEIILTIVTRPVPIIKSQSIRLLRELETAVKLDLNNPDTQPVKQDKN